MVDRRGLCLQAIGCCRGSLWYCVVHGEGQTLRRGSAGARHAAKKSGVCSLRVRLFFVFLAVSHPF